jgi:zinc finger RNA-binding protein
LTEKAINSAGMPISPGEALRIVLEVISSGLLLPMGPGLLDPCEKESYDAISGLSNQAREDITAFAQVNYGPSDA